MTAGSWGDLAAADPELAAFAEERLRAAPAFLATVDGDGAPRVHPVTPIFGGGRLFVFMEPTSPKGRDLRERPPYALHNGVADDAGSGGEVFVRGTGHADDDPVSRAVAAEAAGYRPADRYVLFELRVATVVITTYDGGRSMRRRWPA